MSPPDQVPPMTNYSMAGRSYRYMEETPLYPFGYGLSYTTFRYNDLQIPASIIAGNDLLGSVVVDNEGSLDADEVRTTQ